MDPLSLLREYTRREALSEIRLVNDTIHFSTDYSFPSSIESAYQSKHHTRRYTLDTLVHFITNHNLKHTDYMQHARAHRVTPVTLPDRKPLLDYLTGKIDSSDAILPLDFPQIDRTNEPELPNQEEKNPMEMIRERERVFKDREAMLVCRNRDFYSVFVSAVKRDEESKRNESLVRKDSVVAKNRIDSGKMMKIGEGVPIILVPSAFSTLITMYNVKDFLEDGVFLPTDVKMKMMKEGKPECVTVQKKFSRDRVVAAYEVRDKPSALKSDDWERVVAVFVLGKEWQFKDWPFKDHVEVFNKILGFYMRFEDDSVESAKTVKQWNVKIISISKNKRHQDRAAALEVWEKLEEFMRSRSR